MLASLASLTSIAHASSPFSVCPQCPPRHPQTLRTSSGRVVPRGVPESLLRALASSLPSCSLLRVGQFACPRFHSKTKGRSGRPLQNRLETGQLDCRLVAERPNPGVRV